MSGELGFNVLPCTLYIVLENAHCKCAFVPKQKVPCEANYMHLHVHVYMYAHMKWVRKLQIHVYTHVHVHCLHQHCA